MQAHSLPQTQSAETRVEFLFQVLIEVEVLFRVDAPYSRVPLRIMSYSCEGETQIWQHMFAQNNKVTENEP